MEVYRFYDPDALAENEQIKFNATQPYNLLQKSPETKKIWQANVLSGIDPRYAKIPIHQSGAKYRIDDKGAKFAPFEVVSSKGETFRTYDPALALFHSNSGGKVFTRLVDMTNMQDYTTAPIARVPVKPKTLIPEYGELDPTRLANVHKMQGVAGRYVVTNPRDKGDTGSVIDDDNKYAQELVYGKSGWEKIKDVAKLTANKFNPIPFFNIPAGNAYQVSELEKIAPENPLGKTVSDVLDIGSSVAGGIVSGGALLKGASALAKTAGVGAKVAPLIETAVNPTLKVGEVARKALGNVPAVSKIAKPSVNPSFLKETLKSVAGGLGDTAINTALSPLYNLEQNDPETEARKVSGGGISDIGTGFVEGMTDPTMLGVNLGLGAIGGYGSAKAKQNIADKYKVQPAEKANKIMKEVKDLKHEQINKGLDYLEKNYPNADPNAVKENDLLTARIEQEKHLVPELTEKLYTTGEKFINETVPKIGEEKKQFVESIPKLDESNLKEPITTVNSAIEHIATSIMQQNKFITRDQALLDAQKIVNNYGINQKSQDVFVPPSQAFESIMKKYEQDLANVNKEVQEGNIRIKNIPKEIGQLTKEEKEHQKKNTLAESELEKQIKLQQEALLAIDEQIKQRKGTAIKNSEVEGRKQANIEIERLNQEKQRLIDEFKNKNYSDKLDALNMEQSTVNILQASRQERLNAISDMVKQMNVIKSKNSYTEADYNVIQRTVNAMTDLNKIIYGDSNKLNVENAKRDKSVLEDALKQIMPPDVYSQYSSYKEKAKPSLDVKSTIENIFQPTRYQDSGYTLGYKPTDVQTVDKLLSSGVKSIDNIIDGVTKGTDKNPFKVMRENIGKDAYSEPKTKEELVKIVEGIDAIIENSQKWLNDKDALGVDKIRNDKVVDNLLKNLNETYNTPANKQGQRALQEFIYLYYNIPQGMKAFGVPDNLISGFKRILSAKLGISALKEMGVRTLNKILGTNNLSQKPYPWLDIALMSKNYDKAYANYVKEIKGYLPYGKFYDNTSPTMLNTLSRGTHAGAMPNANKPVNSDEVVFTTPPYSYNKEKKPPTVQSNYIVSPSRELLFNTPINRIENSKDKEEAFLIELNDMVDTLESLKDPYSFPRFKEQVIRVFKTKDMDREALINAIKEAMVMLAKQYPNFGVDHTTVKSMAEEIANKETVKLD